MTTAIRFLALSTILSGAGTLQCPREKRNIIPETRVWDRSQGL